MMPADPSATTQVKLPAPRNRGPFAKFMNKYGTPFTTVFFLISTVTGVALFFHWGPMAFHPMHEWLSMVLLLAFALHLIKNWTPLVNYGRRGLLYGPIFIGVLASVYFFVQPSGNPAGNKQVAFRLAGMVTKAHLADLAPLFGTNTDGVVERLRVQKITVDVPDETIEQVAKANNRTANEVILALMPGKQQSSGRKHRDRN